MTRPRQAKTVVTKPNSPPRRHTNRSPSPKASNFPPTVTAVKALMVNAAKSELNGGYVAFGGNPKGGKISGKGKIRTWKLDFDDVYFVKELKFNLFSVSQIINEDNAAGTLVPAVGQISTNNTNTFSVAGPSNAAVSPTHRKSSYVDSSQLPDDLIMPELEDITYSDDEDNVSEKANFNNLETSITISPIPTTKVHKDHLVTQIIGDLSSATETKSMKRVAKDQGGLSQMNNDDFHTCMFVCFLSQEEPKRKVWVLVDLPHGKRAIGTKWVFRNKKDERGIVVRNKAQHVTQGHTQEEGIDYEEVFAPVEEVYVCQPLGFEDPDYPDKEEVYVCQPLGFEDPDYPDKVYKVVKAFYGLHQAFRACSIKYALTVNPNIYVSCIKQFWTSVAVNKVNDVTRLQALVDKKRVIIMEATIRDELRLDDAEGVECLPNEEIFTKLARMGYEKPSTKLSEECGQFNQVLHVSTFLLTYDKSPSRVGKGFSGVETPLFEGMIVEQQVGEGANEVHIKDVSTAGVAAEGVANVADDEVPAAVNEPPIPRVKNLEQDKIAQALEITKLKQRVKKLERRNKLKVSKLRRLKKVGTIKNVETSDDTVMDDVSKQGMLITNMDTDKDVTLKDVAAIAKDVYDAKIEESSDGQGRQSESQAQIYQIDLEHADKVLSMQDVDIEPAKLQEVVEVVTTAKLITEVVTVASTTITAAAPQLTTAAAPTLTTAPNATRRRKRVVIRDPEESATPSTIIHSEAKSKEKGKGIQVEEPKHLKKQAQIKQDEAYARELEAELNKNLDWDEVIDHVKRKQKEDNAVKIYQALKRKPQTKAQARKNMMIYLRNMTKEQMDEEYNRALKRLSESQEDKAAKKQKLDEEVAELKRHLQIVPNDEDDVYTEATPLACKVRVVDYDIYTENNKPYYKIIRADESPQLFLSFLSLLRNFDQEDLEVLWELVKESSSMEESKNSSCFSKGQELEIVRILWSAYYQIHLYTYDLVSREMISTFKVYSGSTDQHFDAAEDFKENMLSV
nr:hypothetical protein [Tanacetum cinerariifolium]